LHELGALVLQPGTQPYGYAGIAGGSRVAWYSRGARLGALIRPSGGTQLAASPAPSNGSLSISCSCLLLGSNGRASIPPFADVRKRQIALHALVLPVALHDTFVATGHNGLVGCGTTTVARIHGALVIHGFIVQRFWRTETVPPAGEQVQAKLGAEVVSPAYQCHQTTRLICPGITR
jgi:hypothetical protein